MTGSISALRIFSLTFCIFLFCACDTSPTAQSIVNFDKLCNIYKDNDGKYNVLNIPSAKMYDLMSRIEKEIPNLMELYGHVVNAAPEERYQLIQQVAEIKTKKKWDCPAIESFYSGK